MDVERLEAKRRDFQIIAVIQSVDEVVALHAQRERPRVVGRRENASEEWSKGGGGVQTLEVNNDHGKDLEKVLFFFLRIIAK